MVDRTKETLKGAVATNKGWVNPTTGELLVSIRGLPNAIAWSRGPIKIDAPVQESKEEAKVEVKPAVEAAPKAAKKTPKKTPKTAE